MKTLIGKTSNISKSLIGRVSRAPRILSLNKANILITESQGFSLSRLACLAYLSDTVQGSGLPSWLSAPGVTSIASEDLLELHDGDILQLEKNGRIARLWDIRTHDNAIFVTNTCNCQCMMCPQPPGPDHENFLARNQRILSLLEPGSVSRITFTGGEPTLKLDALIQLLVMSNKRFPNAPVFVLTNARRLKDLMIAQQLVAAHPKITFCTPLFSDIDTIHDKIVGAKGAFEETLQALQNLALLGQRIELRTVMVRDNCSRMPQFSEFVYRNLPFVVHVAFMGMETIGLAEKNIEAVWIEPSEYMENLAKAVAHLNQRNMDVSIYNLPLCLVPKNLWKFVNDSISQWKKTFLPVCAPCSQKEQCPGLFSTSRVHSIGIDPIQ